MRYGVKHPEEEWWCVGKHPEVVCGRCDSVEMGECGIVGVRGAGDVFEGVGVAWSNGEWGCDLGWGVMCENGFGLGFEKTK